MAQGLMVFRSLVEAVRAGFAVHDRTDSGYVVVRRSDKGLERALVVLAKQ